MLAPFSTNVRPQKDVKATLKPYQVPWMISPSMSGVTLIHGESDTSPECRVIFGAGRLQATDLIDSRCIELTFENCAHARVSPKHDDYGLDREGFNLIDDGSPSGVAYLKWLPSQWRQLGYCPRSGFWVALSSPWLNELRINGSHHYVVAGRNGYVEVIASSFSWREWEWTSGRRDDVVHSQSIANGSGNGFAA